MPPTRSRQPTIAAQDFRLYFGDHPRGAEPALDDAAWRGLDLARLPQQQGVYWIRGRIDISRRSEQFRPLGIRISVLGSRELYWDGRLLGRSGLVGDSRQTEVPGPLDEPFLIPPDLGQPGSHLLAIRISNFHYALNLSRYFQGLDIADYNTLIASPL